MATKDSELYIDLYGEDEDEEAVLEEVPTTIPAGSKSTTVPTSTPVAKETSAPKTSSSPQGRTQQDNYASQVAQQFSAYQKQQTSNVVPTALSPVSPVSPVSPASTSLQSAIPTFQSSYQGSVSGTKLHTVRPSDMKDEGKMFIGGLNWETTDDALRDYLSQYGAVEACTIMRDPTGRSRGFAFIAFELPDSVDLVLNQHEHILDGKSIDPKRAVPRQEYLKHQRVFVGGLPPTVTAASMRAHFARFGEVVDCMVMLDRETNRSKGFGFVTYSDASGMERALAAAPIELDGKVIEVKEATPRNAQRGNTPRSQVDSEPQAAAPADNTWNANSNGMMNFHPAQMAQLYGRMMQMNQGMGMGMGMVNPAMMMNNNMGMGGMGMMNPMAMMGYGMGPMSGSMRGGATNPMAGGGRGTRGTGFMGGSGGPSRVQTRGSNNFHPYAR